MCEFWQRTFDRVGAPIQTSNEYGENLYTVENLRYN